MEVPHLCFGLVAPPVGNHQTPRSDRTQQANLLSPIHYTITTRPLCFIDSLASRRKGASLPLPFTLLIQFRFYHFPASPITPWLPPCINIRA